MKSKFLFVALTSLLTMTVFNSCEKEDDDDTGGGGVINNNTITAKVENGSDYNGEINLVKALIVTGERRNPQTGHYEWTGHEVGSSSYSNGGFTLKLLESVDDRYLQPGTDELPEGLTISNPDVKIGFVTIVAYDESGAEIGSFELYSEDYEGILLYADGNVSVTGSSAYDDERTYNLQLKKGWNTVYVVGDDEATTQTPSRLKWYFDYN
jgi:hypothetical protein